MKNVIKNLKQRIEENKKALYEKNGDNCTLIKPILEAINLLLSANSSDNQIKSYLQSVNGSIEIIEEKLKRIDKNKLILAIK